jgi:hypothetical protein
VALTSVWPREIAVPASAVLRSARISVVAALLVWSDGHADNVSTAVTPRRRHNLAARSGIVGLTSLSVPKGIATRTQRS